MLKQKIETNILLLYEITFYADLYSLFFKKLKIFSLLEVMCDDKNYINNFYYKLKTLKNFILLKNNLKILLEK